MRAKQRQEATSAEQKRIAKLERENAALESELSSCQQTGASLRQAEVEATRLEKQERAAQEHLAELAKQAAIAHEQEKAAQQRWEQINCWRGMLNAIAIKPEIETFLGEVQATLTEQMGAESSAIFFYDAIARAMYLHTLYENGRIILAKDSDHPSAQKVAFLDEQHPGLAHLYVHGECIVCPDLQTDQVLLPEHRIHLLARGTRALLKLPLVFRHKVLGSFTLRFNETRQFSIDEIEIGQALVHQATLAIEINRLAEEAKQAAILEERNRIAREIHDTLAQGFTGVIVQLEAAKGVLATQPETAQAHLNRAGELAREGLQEARRSVWCLRPEALESQDLPTALLRTVRQMTYGTPIKVEVCVEGTPYKLPTALEQNLLRIGQEALTNVLKHAQAQTVQLNLRFETISLESGCANAIHLQISDDGQGFNPQQQQTHAGFGITSMQERSQQLGGQFNLTSHLGNGTIVTVTLPVT